MMMRGIGIKDNKVSNQELGYRSSKKYATLFRHIRKEREEART
ncbi:hypothetical protein J2Z23_000069 [Lederbergia galactosidilyticus]|nr:hypothetical protein [Lederbergia galactosidilytica]